MTNDEHQHDHAQTSTEQIPAELRDVIPQLQGEPDEDHVLDAQEAAAEGHSAHAEGSNQAAHTDGDTQEVDDTEDEYIDADDLMELLGQMKEMLEAQSKEIRGLRREMRELREAGGVQAPAPRPPRDDRGGSDRGGFRPRDDQRGFGGSDRGGNDRGERSFGGNSGGNDRGGFRPRDDRGGSERPSAASSSVGGDREFRPRETSGGDEGGFRPRARADRGWGNKRTDEE